jgi:hypothetical protein
MSLRPDPDLEKRFTYHPPKEGQPRKYELLRAHAKALAYTIKDNTPASREQSLALTKLEEAVFWANAAIARNE